MNLGPSIRSSISYIGHDIILYYYLTLGGAGLRGHR